MPRRSIIAALSIHAQIDHWATQWDLKQSSRKFYNPNALALYLKAADRAAEMVTNGAPLSDALAACFNDRLLAFLQRRMMPATSSIAAANHAPN